MLHALGLESLLEHADEEAPDEVAGWRREREEARAARDFERADLLRDELAAAAGRSATPPTASPRAPRGMIVYGRNPVREALRGRRRVHRVYATERAAREVFLGEVECERVEAWQVEERCDSPDHQGICAEVQAYPYADADDLLAPRTRS